MAAEESGSVRIALEEFRAELDAFAEKIPPGFKDSQELEAFRTKTSEERSRLRTKAEKLHLDFPFQVMRARERVKAKEAI